MITAEEYERAEHDLLIREWRRGFRLHVTTYAIVNAALLVMNVVLVATTSASFYWFPFPLVGWGVGVAMHYALGVRRAEQEIARRQARVEERAERLHVAA